ncbi:MAG: ATP-binding protein [Chloroflexi bacterium]|nr:ATP-binding protein [Chloroflexota bacterium]
MGTGLIDHLPRQPRTVAETGLSLSLLAELTLKNIHFQSVLSAQEIADALKLPLGNVIRETLDHLQRERLVDLRASEGAAPVARLYSVSHIGQRRIREMLDHSRYVGPAPVELEQYVQMVHAQSFASEAVTPAAIRAALAHLVLNDDILAHLGPAITGGKSVFLFGNTGNGKTSIGLGLGTLLTGAIWIPYAIEVQGQIIKVFDPLRHRIVPQQTESESAILRRKGLLNQLARGQVELEATFILPANQPYDQRWIPIRRPLIVGGGELTLANLDLIFDPATRYYEAPQQMKANGGMFLLDDLGRQAAAPREILNRWIVPLDRRVDYLQLASGHRFQTPFDVAVVFATNLTPSDLVEESFLRRIRSKLYIPDPTWDQFREIFIHEAAHHGVAYSEQNLQYLISEYYHKPNRAPRGAHPRDLLDALVDIAKFQNCAPTMSKPLVDAACQFYLMNEHPATSA